MLTPVEVAALATVSATRLLTGDFGMSTLSRNDPAQKRGW